MNAIVRLKFELAYYDVAVQYLSHKALVIGSGNGFSDPSSNPGQGCFHFVFGKGTNPSISPLAVDKLWDRLDISTMGW